MKDGSDEYHKWAANDESAVSVERRIENAITGVSKDSQMAKMIWETELRTYQQDFQQAVDSILRSQFSISYFLDSKWGVPCGVQEAVTPLSAFSSGTGRKSEQPIHWSSFSVSLVSSLSSFRYRT
jgi:hypothetical protein